MYESFFGFVKRPFLAASTLDRYFPATCIEQTFQTTSRAIQRAEGPVAIFGGTGLGKTMCCLRIAESFRRNFDVVMLSSSQLITRRALLQSLLFELRMPYRDMSEGELRLTLMSRLQPSSDNPSDGLVLVIDEAQTLSMKLLDEIRLLTNVVRNGIPRVRLVLCGTMRLEDCLSHPHMDSLNQRLAARCYLTPLSNQETGHYVIHKIELSGVESSTVMTREALDAIYRGSDGIPRLIDQLADQSLLLACNARERPVSAAMVGRAWCMLQQLPNPWSEPESIVKSTPFQAIAQSKVDSTPAPTSQNPFVSNEFPEETPASSFSKSVESIFDSVSAIDSNSNIEFGQLEDDFRESMQTGPTTPREFDEVSENVIAQTNKTSPSHADSDFEDTVEVPESSASGKKNLLDVFAGDFDEEFSIPVQSSDSYQAYSGASYGNLNHDISSFGISHLKPIEGNRFVFEEPNEFLSCPMPAHQNVRLNLFAANQAPQQDVVPIDGYRNGSNRFNETPVETISNISSEQAANLELQIEEEMRDMVSGLNMSAMTFDPAIEVEPFSNYDTLAFRQLTEQKQADDRRLAHQAHTDVITFSGMHDYSSIKETERIAERAAMGDDRDLLVIEDDLETIRGGVSQASSVTQRAVLHPYAKLFTKLRNS